MKPVIFIISLFLVNVTPALALDVGDITSFIHSNSTTLSKEIKNTTNDGRLVNVKVEKLSSPLEGGIVIPMEKKDELLLTPASLLLPAQNSDVVRFFYQGSNDDKERYYRIVWFDQALSDAQNGSSNKSAVATASARIGTILVVAPRKVNFDYHYANGKITNTGNATLRVIAYGPCLKKDDGKECKENYYLMPGKSRTFSRVNAEDKKGRVAMWQAEKFVSVK